MSNNEPKMTGRGQFAVRAWEDLKKSGGLSYSPEQIQAIFKERDEKMLTREEVINRVSTYFQNCTTVIQDEDTQEINYVWKRNPTKSGLAIALGVSSGTICDYVKGIDRHGNKYKENPCKIQRINTKDFDIIKKAYNIIESFYEEQLAGNRNNSGTIFWLLNRENTKWSNQQEFMFGKMEQQEHPVLTIDQLPRLDDLEDNTTFPYLKDKSENSGGTLPRLEGD